MAVVGQLQPIVVCEDGRLIAGAHRLAAAKRLLWSEIRAESTEDDDSYS
jgi:ParB-like chromosome segregation protein Spo0J